MGNEKTIDYFVMEARAPVTFNSIERWPLSRYKDLQILVFSLSNIRWDIGDTKDFPPELKVGIGTFHVVDVIYSGGQQIKKGENISVFGYRPKLESQYNLEDETGKHSIIATTKSEIMLANSMDRIVMFPEDGTLYIAMLAPSDRKEKWKVERLSNDVEDAFSGGKPMKGFRDKLRSFADKRFNNHRK